jgi:hypothetical protein
MSTQSCRTLFGALAILGLSACGSLMNQIQTDLANDLTVAALNHDDPETVGSALPAYLLLLDASARKPDASADALCSAAKLYGAYSGGFVTDEPRARRLSVRGYGYGRRGACEHNEQMCELQKLDFDQLTARSKRFDEDELPALACVAGAWAGYVQAHASEPDAQIDVPKVRALYERIAELDPNYGNGEAQMLLGVMNSLLPPAFGGKPDQGKKHFEAAISQSSGKNLMAKVLYAQYYARLLFEQELHDRLLNEVLQADSNAGDLTLQNQIAKQRAQALLESGKDYF